jgi:RND family efflux transporter MFP subunit
MEKRNCMLIIFLAASFLLSCAPKEHTEPAVVRKVRIARPVKEAEVTSREFPGMIREAAEVNLAFRVAGPIRKIYVKEGDFIKQGTLVAEIDPRDYEIQTEIYQAQYAQVKAEFDRLAELNSRKSVADNDFEKAVSGEKMLRMKLKNATDQLNDTRLYAPFSGYIQSVKYEEGEMVNTGMTIATLIDVKSLLVEADLPMSFFIRRNDFTGFSLSQPLVTDTAYPLQLAGYQMKANNSRLYRATFILDPGANSRLAPGMHANVIITCRETTAAPLKIPIPALFYEDGKTYVWIFTAATSSVKKQEVTVGEIAGPGQVRILSGLAESDEIVVSGVNVLSDGLTVTRMQPAAATNVGGLM